MNYCFCSLWCNVPYFLKWTRSSFIDFIFFARPWALMKLSERSIGFVHFLRRSLFSRFLKIPSNSSRRRSSAVEIPHLSRGTWVENCHSQILAVHRSSISKQHMPYCRGKVCRRVVREMVRFILSRWWFKCKQNLNTAEWQSERWQYSYFRRHTKLRSEQQ